jgi:drug/metabolite transporter (DMT)-like permease
MIECLWLLVLAVIWGSSYFFIKLALVGLPPLTLITVRCTLAAAMLVALLGYRRQALPSDAASWRGFWLLSIFNSAGAWSLLAWGQQHIDSALASVLNSTSPLFVLVISTAMGGYRSIGPARIAGVLAGIAGVILCVGSDVLQGAENRLMGQLAVIAASMLYACAAIYGRRFESLSPVAVAAGSLICASVMLIPACLVIDRPWTLEPRAQAMAAALVLAVVCTGLALTIYFRLLRTLGSLGVASQSYLRAGVGVALGVLLLDESLTPVVTMGLLLTIAAVIVRPQ